MADQSKISNSLTQAQVDAEALYAKAASIDPYTAALIKKNAQGNLLSPGVLTSLSQLGVDAKSGVANSIANINAATQDQRLADQKKVAQDREVKKFEDTARGQLWKVVKGVSMGAMTTLGTTWNWMSAQGRQGIEGISQAARGFGIAGAAKPLGVTASKPEKYIPSAFEQTVAGQIIIKSIQDGKKGQFPKLDLGTGFFPSEETGQGYAARQASLSAAKVAILDSNGDVKGYRPASLFGDAYASIFTLGHPESQAGQVLSLVADISGSFALDPGLGRASEIKALRKLAAQQRAANAATAAAKTEDRIAQLTKLEDEALAEAAALKKQADELKKIDLDAARAARNEARAARTGAAEDVIKSKQSVKIAQSRLDDFAAIEAREVENLKSAIDARVATEAAFKAPKQAARAEKLLATQRKQLEEMTAAREDALARGLTPSIPEEDIASLADAIKLTEKNLTDAKALIGDDLVTQEALDAARALEKKAKARVKEIKGEVAYVAKQVGERSRTERLMEGIRERAMSDTVKAVKNEKTLSEKLSDATLSLKDKRKSWELAVLRLANADQTLERPEFAYQYIAEFLTNGRGTKAVDQLVEMTDWKALWRKADGRLTHEQAKALAEATTPDEVVDILAPYIKRGQIQAGALEPGRLVRMGEKAAERTQWAVPTARRLMGVGAKVQSRINEHVKVASFFEGFVGGIKAPVTILKPKLVRGYKTTVKAGAIINIHDREELLRSVEDFGKAADLPKDVLDNLIDEIANAQSNSVAGYAASVKLLDAVFAAKADKIPANMKEAFDNYTTAFKESAEQMSSYWATRHAQGANLKYMMLNGESVILPGAHLDSEFLNSTIYMPPVAELLKMTSKVAKYPVTAWSRKVGDTLIGDYWKTIQLVRPAYIIRNIAEEQIRVGAVGHASFFTRPGMALAMWLGKEDGPWVRRLLKQFDTYSNTVFDESFSTGDEAADILNETVAHGMKNSYIDMMNSAKSGFDERDFRVLSLKNVAPVEFGHPRFFDGVTNQLRMLNSSEMARVVAGYDPKFVKDAMAKGQFREEAVIDYFLTGPGRKHLERFAEGTPDKFRAFIKTPEGLKAYLFTGKSDKGIDVSLLARINETTGGNKALQNMVAYGKVNVGGVDLVIPRVSQDAINSIQNSKAMKQGKKALLDEQAALAKEIKKFFGESGNWDGVRVNVPSKNAVYAEKSVDRTRFVEWFFDKSTELEKNSTFGPEFRQAYWDAINEIAKALDANAKAKLLKVAENSLNPLQKAGVNVGSKHPVWNAFRSATGDGPLTLEDAHIYADNYARRHVKELFYNAHEKRLIFHQLRLIAPFANAWENTVRKWSELALDNPVGVYKAIKGIEWATKPASSAIYQMTDAQDYYDPNQGFFFTDPNSGQRQFFVPFTGTVMASLAKGITGVDYKGAPIAFSANPMSFNFAFGAGTMLPGIGPGVTLPLSALGTFNGNFIDAMPMGVQKWLFPFGRANFSGGLQTAILPGNWNKILGGLTGMEQTYASNFKPVMNYLASGANYNLDNPEDQARLVADTDTFARWESVMRGVIGLVSPMALLQQGLAKDKDGDLTLQTALYEDFQTMYQANDGDYNKTWFDFLNTYGASQAFAIISSSAGEGPSNWDSYAFVVSNPDVATKYKDVWGYVMPGGGLSTEMYQWNVSHGLKKQLTPTEILQKVNNQRFYAARDALLSRVDAGEFNRTQYSEALASLKNMMGGGPVVEFDPNKREKTLRQLNELVADKRFVDLPSVSGLRNYMAIRQHILSTIGKTKFTGAQNEQSARDYLAAEAERIVTDYPDFQKMFYGFFANELEGK